MAVLFSLVILIIQADLIASGCLPGYFEKYGFCVKCQLYCKACNSSQCYGCYPSDCLSDICDYANCDRAGCSANHHVVCSGCPDGFYMEQNVCLRCDHTNCKCLSATGCDECLPGYHGISNFCNDNCSTECLTCSSSAHCTECVAGKYGPSCQHNCKSTCENGTCDKVLGTCLGECAADEYLDSGVCKPCPTRCLSCVNSTNCPSCKQSFHWNPICKYDCTGCLGRCNKNDGCSAGCSEPAYYKTYNKDKKGYECIRCFNQCFTCDNETYCTSCKDNYWGRQCRYSCDNCDGTCDKDNGCVNKCELGYHREQVDTGYECIRCFNQCLTCDNKTYCSSCKDNYWGQQCRYSCDNCNGICDKDYGCVTNCKLGFYREQVDTGYECKPCSVNCDQCLDFSECIVCEDGYYISDTGFNCIACPVNCKDNACNKRNGTCTRGCSTGNTGYHCNKECPNNCVDCDQFNASKCDSCKSEYYGDQCEQLCSKACKQEHGFHECHKQDGSCVNGCGDGYWAKTCTEPCADGCFDNLCNETNGACLLGCKSGYYGVTCSLECSDKSYENSSVTKPSLANLDSNKTVNIGLAVAVGILGIVAMTLTVGIIFLWKSRKTNHSTTQRCHEDDRTLGDSHQTRNTELTTSDVGGYEDLTSVRPEEKMYSTITNEYENTNLSL